MKYLEESRKWVSNLCLPAKIEFYLGLISLILGVVQNLSSNNLCFGNVECKQMKPHVLQLVVSLLFALAWTWGLDYLCRKGYNKVAWVLLLWPFILVIGLMVVGVSLGFLTKI